MDREGPNPSLVNELQTIQDISGDMEPSVEVVHSIFGQHELSQMSPDNVPLQNCYLELTFPSSSHYVYTALLEIGSEILEFSLSTSQFKIGKVKLFFLQ